MKTISPLFDDDVFYVAERAYSNGDYLSTDRERLILALEAVARIMKPEWQPIASAPKDGTPVLIAKHNPNQGDPDAWWIDCAENFYQLSLSCKDQWTARESHIVSCKDPTNWMHLPPPPNEGEK